MRAASESQRGRLKKLELEVIFEIFGLVFLRFIAAATGRLIATSAAFRAFVRGYLARPSTAATTALWRRALSRGRATAYKAAPGSAAAQQRDAKVAINTLLDCLVN